MNALEVISLGKWYGRIRGVEDLSFSVGQGEVFGYLGPNGSGKTTTLRCVLGFLKPSSGETRVFGQPVVHGLATQHHRIGYLPGDFRIWPDLTARKSLEMLGALGGGVLGGAVSRDDNGNRADHGRAADHIDHDPRRRREELAERLDLDLDRRVRDLSKGNRQKIAVLFAFQHQPDLLILDEPTTSLDPLVRQTVMSLIREAAADGATVFLSSHDLAEVAGVCGRAGILRSGRLVELAPISQIVSQSECRMKVWFTGDAPEFPAEHFKQARVVHREGGFLLLAVRGTPDEILKWLAQFPVERISTPEPTLEEAFMVYYHEGAREKSDAHSEGTT